MSAELPDTSKLPLKKTTETVTIPKEKLIDILRQVSGIKRVLKEHINQV